jgi:peptidoglycan/xylan/chitin deacetylase (PgdA/CDA1 family)
MYKGKRAVYLGLVFTMCFLSLPGAQYQRSAQKDQAAAKIPWPEGKKAAISLTFDDARLSQVDTGLPIFDKYGIKATFYISPDRLEERLEGWKKAAQNGHEIGNHTMTHPCTGNYPAFRFNALEEMTLDQMAREIDGATQVIEKFLGVKPASFAYPCGQTFVGRGKNVKSYVPLVAGRFLSGRKWLSEGANDPAFCDLAQLLAMESDGKTFEQIKVLVDQAAEEGRWLVLAGHEIGKEAYQTTLASGLESLCRYAKDPASGLWIDTVGNIARYICQVRKE